MLNYNFYEPKRKIGSFIFRNKSWKKVFYILSSWCVAASSINQLIDDELLFGTYPVRLFVLLFGFSLS